MYIYPLPRIYNTSLVSAYFGLDKRECVSRIFIFLILFIVIVLCGVRDIIKEWHLSLSSMDVVKGD
jgi:hypothetical protein